MACVAVERAMASQQTYSTEFIIRNKLGFHVRPIQRFAELARAFVSEIEVRVEDRKAQGKSVLHLMGLKASSGALMKVTAQGGDARQTICVLQFLAENCFFVEENLEGELHPLRHMERLVKMASCFKSEIQVEMDGRTADAKRFPELKRLGLGPASKPVFHVRGKDADQARSVMENLVKYRFYVEDQIDVPRQEVR